MSTSIDCYLMIFMISSLSGLSDGNATVAATFTDGLPQTSRPRLDGRIVGGVTVEIEDVPYQASLLRAGSHMCGAAIVGWNICLTAAHCTDRSEVNQLSVRVGSSFRNEGGKVYEISRVIQHPNYNSQTIDSDISILILANEIGFGPGINSIALAVASQPPPAGAEAVVSGWGTTSEGGASAQQLQRVVIPVVSNDACEGIYGPAGVDSEAECSDNPACLRCSPVKGCLKCAVLITQPDRLCVTQCPSGARAQWSTRADYMGRVCVQRGTSINGAGAESMLLGMTNESLTVLTGVIAGSVLCILIISFAIVYVQYKKKTLEQVSETSSELDESNHSGYQHHQRHQADRRGEFLRQVDQLRPHAATFLEMLNDTRRQLRQAHRAGDGGAATAVFRPVICDLAKILILLNRRPDIFISEVQQHQMPPDDWEHLFNWAEKNLKRYKRMSDVSQPQVAQLINFLQTPSVVIDTGTQEHEKDPACTAANIQVMSTFKPNQSIGSTLSLQDVAIKNFNANYGTAQTVLNPQWKFDYALVASTNLPISQFNPNVWKNGTNQYFLEDDFGQLGFRPQDEITTEL